MSENKKQEEQVVVETSMTIPRQIPWLWFMNGVGGSFVTFMNTYIMFFMTEYAGITAMQMSAVLSAARIADLICSLFAGAIVQKGNKYRIYLLICPIVSSIGGSLAFFNPNIPIGIKLVTVAIGYCGIHFPMNFITVARNSTIVLIAGANPTNRITMTSRQIQSQQMALIVLNALTLPLIQVFLDMGMKGYFICQVIYSIIGISTASVIFRITKPYEDAHLANIETSRKSAGQAATDISFADMYKTALKEKAVWGLIIGDSVRSFGQQLVAAAVTYYFRYSAGNVLLTSLQGTIASFVGMTAAVVMPEISRRVGKRNSCLLTTAICAIVYIILIVTADGRPVVYMVLAAIAQCALLLQTVQGANFYLDIAEIQLHDSGKDLRPFYMSLQNLAPKLSFLSSGPSLAFVLNRSGYNINAPVVIPDTQVFVTNWGALTAVFYAIAFVTYFLLYRVDEQRAREIAVINADRARSAREAAEEKEKDQD